jgi:hypothetical protein
LLRGARLLTAKKCRQVKRTGPNWTDQVPCVDIAQSGAGPTILCRHERNKLTIQAMRIE